MSEQRVALHLTHTDSTTLFTALDGLVREVVDFTRGSHLELVVDHVTETLVVDQANINIAFELLAGDAGVHGLVAVVVVACGAELVAKVIRGCVLLREAEGG